MRLIDADHLNEKMIPNCPIEEGGIPLPDFATHIKILEMYPTVDAAPVVRCKDCKFLGFKDFSGICRGMKVYGIVKPNDYCSWGERKEDG